MTDLRPKSCDRARLSVSLVLDDELSDFEVRLLEAHLERCAECREYDRSVRALTATLRMERLDMPSRAIVLPSRPRRSFGLVRVAAPIAAAAVGLVAFLGVQASTQRLHTRLQGTPSPASDINAFRALRIKQMTGPAARARTAPGRSNRGANV